MMQHSCSGAKGTAPQGRSHTPLRLWDVGASPQQTAKQPALTEAVGKDQCDQLSPKLMVRYRHGSNATRKAAQCDPTRDDLLARMQLLPRLSCFFPNRPKVVICRTAAPQISKQDSTAVGIPAITRLPSELCPNGPSTQPLAT